MNEFGPGGTSIQSGLLWQLRARAIDKHVSFYPSGAIFDETDASLIVTNKRLICLLKKYDGLLFRNFNGYDNIKYEIHIDDVVFLKTSGRVKTGVKITTAKVVYPWKGVINGIGFNTINQANSFINLMTLLIERRGEKPKLEIISENLSIKKNEEEIKMLNNKISETETLLEALDKKFIIGEISEKNYEELKVKYNSILKDYLIKLDARAQ